MPINTYSPDTSSIINVFIVEVLKKLSHLESIFLFSYSSLWDDQLVQRN